MNALQSVSLLISVLVISGAASADVPKLEPVTITGAGQTSPAKAKSEAPKAEAPTAKPAPSTPVRVQQRPKTSAPQADNSANTILAEAKETTKAALLGCMSTGRSLAFCLEEVEANVETRVANCGQKQLARRGDYDYTKARIETINNDMWKARFNLVDSAAKKAKRIGAGPRQTRMMKARAIYSLLEQVEALATTMCDAEAFDKLIEN